MRRWWRSSWMRALIALTAVSLLTTACSDPRADFSEPGGGEAGEAIQIPGLTDTVHVAVDGEGIPHIECATAPDCAAALGYLHAKNRFFQLEVRRDAVRGKLHTLIIPALASEVADIDQANRTTYLTKEGTPIEEAALETASDETMAMLTAYTAGVNYYIDRAREDPTLWPREFSATFGGLEIVNVDGIQDWSPADSIASVVALVDGLTNSSGSELNLGALQAQYTAAPDVFQDLLLPRPISKATTLFGDYDNRSPMAGRVIARPQGQSEDAQGEDLQEFYGAIQDALQPIHFREALLGRKGEVGSNNWAVGGAKSKSGNALLSNDPHLGMTNPAIWYLVEMTAEDGSMHVQGVSFAGLPWVILGQNADIAWGATTTYFDQADVFLDTLTSDGKSVERADGSTVELLTYDTSFTVGEGSNEKTFDGTAKIDPDHGPIIGQQGGKAVALQWTGADLSTDVNVLTQLMTATSVKEARDDLKLVTTLGQNWVVIDTQGNFGWFPYNHVPKRAFENATLNPGLPLPGDGSVTWDGYLDLEQLPQLYDYTDTGYVATANNDMTGQLWDGDPTNDGIPIFQTGTADGLRVQRIQDRLDAIDSPTIDDMVDIVGDTYMLLRDYVIPQIQTILQDANDPAYDETKTRVQALADWSGFCPTGLQTIDPEGAPSDDADERAASTQCLIFHRFIQDLRVAIFKDELDAAAGTDGDGNTRSHPRANYAAMTDLLADNPDGRLQRTDYWDDITTAGVTETPADIIKAALDKSFDAIPALFDGDTDSANWLWGRVHRVTFQPKLFPQFGIKTFDNGPFAAPGGFSTVDVGNPTGLPDNGFDMAHGASMRLDCEGKPDGMVCRIQLPGGQIDDPDSPFYDNFVERWLNDESTPFPFGQTVENPTATYEFAPADN